MLTNNDTKLINSLVKKKFRQKYNKFVVEGVKNIKEVLNSSIYVEKIYSIDDTFDDFPSKNVLITERELKKISQLVTPNTALAVCEIPQEKKIQKNGFIIALDDIRDPGNLGTIIRMADWFGIQQIVCSKETVDLYNPKVIQSTMGSFIRVQINYTDLEQFFETYSHSILGTFMDGDNLYKTTLPENAVLLMGNEANGISEKLESFVTQRLSIPRMGKLQQTESLNVAMATSIILGERASTIFRGNS